MTSCSFFIDELWDRIKEEWNKLKPEDLQAIVESMPNRVQAVVKNKGWWTHY